MSALTVTADDFHAHASERPEAHAHLVAWVEAVIGAEMRVKAITEGTLGEGFLTVQEVEGEWDDYLFSPAVMDGELVTRRVVYPAPTPPPCWPAGLSRRAES